MFDRQFESADLHGMTKEMIDIEDEKYIISGIFDDELNKGEGDEFVVNDDEEDKEFFFDSNKDEGIKRPRKVIKICRGVGCYGLDIRISLTKLFPK